MADLEDAGAAGAITAADLTTGADAGAAVVVSENPLNDDEALEALFDQISAKSDAAEAADAGEGQPGAVQQPAADRNAGQTQTKEGEPGNAEAIAAPTSWPAEMKEKWTSVPPEVRQYVANREAEVHREFTRMGEEVARFRPVGELIDQRLEVFDRNGTSPADGIALMLDMQELLEQNPVAGLSAIAASFGIDLATTFGAAKDGQQQAQHQPGNAPPADPRTAALSNQLRHLQQRLTARETQDRRESDRQQELRRQDAAESVRKWSDGKEHFARTDVRKAMSALYANGLATDLDLAYEQACNAIPEVRALLKAEADKKAIADQAKDVAAAKRAIPARNGTRSAVPAKAGRWDADENLEATYDSIAAA